MKKMKFLNILAGGISKDWPAWVFRRIILSQSDTPFRKATPTERFTDKSWSKSPLTAVVIRHFNQKEKTMITSKEIEDWFSTIHFADVGGVEAKHVYQIAEIAYRKGIEDSAAQCESRANSLPYDQCGIARQCAKDILGML
jgi:hypothetical protein